MHTEIQDDTEVFSAIRDEEIRDRVKQLFGAEHANVQPHSGSQANAAVYFSVLNPGDKIFTMDLAHGGQLTHGHKANFSGRFYDVTLYGVSAEEERTDYDELKATARSLRPKLITAGASAYPRVIDFEAFSFGNLPSFPDCFAKNSWLQFSGGWAACLSGAMENSAKATSECRAPRTRCCLPSAGLRSRRR